MAKETLPQLGEALIRGMASGSSFERGKSYYHSRASSPRGSVLLHRAAATYGACELTCTG